MTPRPTLPNRPLRPIRKALFLLLLALDAPRVLLADPPREASAAFDAYAHQVEDRLDHDLSSTALSPSSAAGRTANTGLQLDRLASQPNLPGGARLDHWRGVVFVPGAHAADLESLLRNVSAYPTTFAPQVVRAHADRLTPDHLLSTLRVRQHHVLTVVLDATYDVTFAHPTRARGCSLSRSTRIAEIDSPGTPREHPLAPADEHGFLWRLNTYWSWEQRDGGLLLQLETVSLSRSIPRGLHWIVGPYVDSIPRDSLTFTLTSAQTALLTTTRTTPVRPESRNEERRTKN